MLERALSKFIKTGRLTVNGLRREPVTFCTVVRDAPHLAVVVRVKHHFTALWIALCGRSRISARRTWIARWFWSRVLYGIFWSCAAGILAATPGTECRTRYDGQGPPLHSLSISGTRSNELGKMPCITTTSLTYCSATSSMLIGTILARISARPATHSSRHSRRKSCTSPPNCYFGQTCMSWTSAVARVASQSV